MKLNVLMGEDPRFIIGPERTNAPCNLPPVEFGNIKPVELRVFQKGLTGLTAVDVSSYQITLLVGPPNVRPCLGFWVLTTTEGASPFIPARATKEEVQTALGYCFGPCTVTGANGSYVVTVNAAGIWEAPTATFEGNTLSNVLVFESTPGTATTPAQYRIEVLEVAPARIIPDAWTAGSTTPTNTFTQIDGRLWEITIDPHVDNGFFNLTIDGAKTGFISIYQGAYAVAGALAVIGKPAEVMTNGTGGFFVSFAQDVVAASVGGHLVILPFMEGALDLTSTGVRELLDGVQFAPVKLSVVLEKNGETITIATGDLMLQMPINQPATVTIDAPQMAGLTFAISDDQAYMHVYQSGVWLYDIPLNNPSA